MFSTRRTLLVAAGTLLGFALIAVALGGEWDALVRAVTSVPVEVVAIVALLQTASLVARSEAWQRCIRAAGATVERRRLYRIASLGYLGNIVNGELGFAIRIAAVRRTAPKESPKVAALATTEVPILLVEGALAALVSFTLVGPLHLPGWFPLACFALVAGIMLALRRVAQRGGGHGWSAGLGVLRDRATRAPMVAFVVLAMVAQVLRNLILLHAVGVDASVFDAAAVLVAAAVLGVLPLGPSVGTGAFLVILGANGVAAVGAAGLLLTATGALGAGVYAAWALADHLWAANGLRPRLERRRLSRAMAAAGTTRTALTALHPGHRRVVEVAYFGGLSQGQLTRVLFPHPPPASLAAGP